MKPSKRGMIGGGMESPVFTMFCNIIMFSGLIALYVFWIRNSYHQYILSWIIVLWVSFSGILAMYILYNTNAVTLKFADNVTPFGFRYESRIFPMMLFYSVGIGFLSKMISLLLVVISMQNVIHKSKSDSQQKWPYASDNQFTYYKWSFIGLSGIIFVSLFLIYFAASETGGTFGENMKKNAIYILASLLILGWSTIILYTGVSLYNKNNQIAKIHHKMTRRYAQPVTTTQPVTDQLIS